MTPAQQQVVSAAITDISNSTGVSIGDVLGVLTGFCITDEDGDALKGVFFAETETQKDEIVADMDSWALEDLLTYAKSAKQAQLEGDSNDAVAAEHATKVAAKL